MLDALLALPKLWAMEVAPNGRWVAWTWVGITATADVYAAPTDGSAAPLQLTMSNENCIIIGWTPDSSAVLVFQDQQGDERYCLFRVALDAPGVMEPLTDERPTYFLRGGDLHPNGQWLVYGANIDAAGQAIEQTYVYRQDLVTGKRLVLAKPEKGSYIWPSMNAQGTQVLYQRQDINPGGYQLWCVDIEGQHDRELLNAGDAAKVSASWLPNGYEALYLAEAGTYRVVGLIDVLTGNRRVVLDDPARNIQEAYVPRSGDGRTAVVIAVIEARLCASLLNLETGDELALPIAAGSLKPLAPTPDGAWVGTYFSATQPEDIVRFTRDVVRPETFVSLTRVWERTTLRPTDLTPAADFRWRSVDGLEIQGWLYRAVGVTRGTIVHIHGGPTWHTEDKLDSEIQFYVSQGFHVLSPNYRGSTGFSLTYQDAIKQDGWGGREQDDIRTGIEALITAGIAERGKVGVTGTSYGGYSAWHQITHTSPDLVAAAAPICGMTDLVVDYETTRPDLRPYSEEMLGGRPDQVPERYHERSPINFVQQIKGGLLIVQGLRDPNVTPANVHAVTSALQQSNVEYQLLAFEDEGHGISRPYNEKVLYQRIADFFGTAFQVD